MMKKRKKIDFRKVEKWMLIAAIAMIVPFVFLIFFYPVKAAPLYGKQIGFGLFVLLIYFSLRHERRKASQQRDELRDH